jgi:predicted transcriptional regulator
VSSEEKRSSEPEKPPHKLDLYVIARIIAVVKEHGVMNRTNLATSTGLAYDKLERYLSWMIEKKLVSLNEEGMVSLTELGTESFDELVDWIMRYIGRVRFPKI